MEERYQVATPENVILSYDIAGIGTRFMAALIDLVLYIVISLALMLIYIYIIPHYESQDAGSVITAVYIALTFLLYWGYYIVFELLWGGQSPGKRLIKIRVVRLDGTPASPGQIIIRNISRLVDIFPGFYAVGLLAMFISEQSRRLGDYAAGTLVVRESQSVSLKRLLQADIIAIPVSARARAEAASLPVNRLSKQERQLVHDYVTHRATMNDALRAKLALQIAQAIARQMDLLQPSHFTQADYLLELVEVATEMM